MNWTESDLAAYNTRQALRATSKPCHTEDVKTDNRIALQPQEDKNASQGISGTKQTKCEIEYGRMLSMEFPGVAIIPWGVTLRMQNGHKYTPDYAVLLPDHILLIEVKQRGKNGFRQNSYQRAKVAFDQCRVEFTQFRYGWAEKQGGVWDEKRY